jgi:D-sedoheptulose 7-phosphate isomerase
MIFDTVIDQSITEHFATIELLNSAFRASIKEFGLKLAHTLRDGGTIFWCGNGGSAADSQHLATELVGRFKKNRRALRAIALTTDTSALTCIGNDYSYADIFSRQVEALGRPGDALVGISTSGNSDNILNAFKIAHDMQLTTLALLGKGGGSCKEFADHCLIIPSDSTARIQETHILIGHILCEIIELELDLA